MAKYGNYGWTPEQMERINERRAEKGKKEFRNLRYEDRPRMDRDRIRLNQNPSVKEDEKEISLKDRQAAKTAEFRKKFSPAGSMKREAEGRTSEFRKGFNKSGDSLRRPSSIASKRAIEDEKFRRRFGRGSKGISTPVIQDSYNRIS